MRLLSPKQLLVRQKVKNPNTVIYNCNQKRNDYVIIYLISKIIHENTFYNILSIFVDLFVLSVRPVAWKGIYLKQKCLTSQFKC